MSDYDTWKTTEAIGESDAIKDMAAEQAEADAWEELLTSQDPAPILDDYVAEDQGEVFEFLAAYRARDIEAFEKAAKKFAARLETVAEGHIS